MMNSRINSLRWPARLPLKWLIFALTVFLAHFPYPGLFVRHVNHWKNPSALIEPDSPLLDPLLAELRPRLTENMQPPDALRTVEKFVYEKIKYGWDWDVWGTADYLPTLSEVLEKQTEDCDGRAVVAASLLRKLGYKADIVSDFAHVWVITDQGETMSPGKAPVIATSEKGVTTVESPWRPLLNSTAFGVAVFPFTRELIILIVLWLLLIRSRTSWSIKLMSLWCLVCGLALVRAGGANYLKPNLEAQLLGCANLILGIAVHFIRKFDKSPAHEPLSSNSL